MSSQDQAGGEPPTKRQRTDPADDRLSGLSVTSSSKPVKDPFGFKPITVATTGNIRPSLQLTTVQSEIHHRPFDVTTSTAVPFGGWTEAEHYLFLTNKDQYKKLMAALPNKTESEIHAHEDWFRQERIKELAREEARKKEVTPQSPVLTTNQITPTFSYTVDRKVRVQLAAPSGVRCSQPSSPGATLPGLALAAPGPGPRYPTPQVVTLQNKVNTSASMLSKPVQGKSLVGSDPKTGPTQISFQVPINWTTAGSKSLLDPGKVSLVPIAPTEAKSLLGDKKGSPNDLITVISTDSSLNAVANAKFASAASKSFVTTGKVINSLQPGQLMTQSSGVITVPKVGGVLNSASSGVITVPKVGGVLNSQTIPQKITKSSSFVISNKQYTIVPSSSTQMVTQLVKTDTKKVNKGQITMAEAQIMLPSGPAKISWPVQPMTSCSSDGKQIVITSPVIKPSPYAATKTSESQKITTASLISAGNSVVNRVVGAAQAARTLEIARTTAAVSLAAVNGGKGMVSHAKPTILPTQRNWELVKQSSQLLPQKIAGAQVDTIVASDGNKQKRDTECANNGQKNEKTGANVGHGENADTATSSNDSGQKSDNRVTNDDNVQTGDIKLDGSEKVEAVEQNKNSDPGDIGVRGIVANDNKSVLESEKEMDNKMKICLEKNEKNDDGDETVAQLECSSKEGNNNEAVSNEGMEEHRNMETVDGSKKTETVEVKMEIDENISNASETEKCDGDRKVASEDVGKEEFNPVDAMEWKDGIGELPGSNLKFAMNELGVLEVISDDLECTETLNTSNESELSEPNNTMQMREIKTEPPDLVPENNQRAVGGTDVSIKEEVSHSNKDEISQCENCAEYGFATDFYKDGRFCSQTCVGAFDSKRMRDVKKHGTMSKMVLGLKKGRKKLLLKDGVPREKDAKLDMVGSGKKSKAFVWTRYLEKENAVEAPARLFRNPFPSAKNNFKLNMKLEGVDPLHQSLICVLSVAEVCGYRIRLHFDGYSECFDFWVDIDSPYIFPLGFCEKTGKVLQPPKGFTVKEFNWTSYLKITKSIPAPKSLFTNQPVQPVTPNLFRVGSKLEAVDKKNSSLICVASVADCMGDKVLIHFDSWDDNYDYWCDTTAPYIHPTGYCEENGLVLSPPIDWNDASEFTWERYLTKSKCQAVPARAFKPRCAVVFEVGMKVEVVDKRNPLLVRVATITEVEQFMVRIHFDGWAEVYDYWLDDDSPDLHPPGWCAKTGHPLVPPIGPSDLVVSSGPGVCPTPGCKGIGHIKGAKYSGHHSTFGCPYSDLNMNKESVLGDRLGASIIKPDEPSHSTVREDESKRLPKIAATHNGEHVIKSEPPVVPRKWGRGRRPKSYYLNLEKEQEQDRQEKEEAIRQGIHNSVFTSSMISTPKPEVPLCWDQHCKLLPGVTDIRGNEVNKWSIEQVAAFIGTLPGCQEPAKFFQEEQIDGEAFLLLTQTDIVKILNIKLGPALKIFNSIIMFKNSVEV